MGEGKSARLTVRYDLVMMRFFSYLWLPALLLLGWWAAAEAELFPVFLLPSPGAALARAWQMALSGELLHHALVSLGRVGGGFLLSGTAALFLAGLVYESPFAARSSHLFLESLRVIPPLSLMPLLILWLGIDEAPKLAIVVLASFFPIYLSALTALRTTGERYLELARALRLTRSEVYRHILIPGSAPALITGLRLGFGYAWRALVSAELLAAASGLGYMIEEAGTLMQTDVVFVGVITIALLGMLCDRLFRLLAARILGEERTNE